jgi:hypothetical protein
MAGPDVFSPIRFALPEFPDQAPTGESTAALMGHVEAEILKQLGELRDQGVLTDEEFAAQKAKILGT